MIGLPTSFVSLVVDAQSFKLRMVRYRDGEPWAPRGFTREQSGVWLVDERKKCASTCYTITSMTGWSHQINQALCWIRLPSAKMVQNFKHINQWSRSSAFSPKWFKALRKLRTVSSCLDAGEWQEKIIDLKTTSTKTTPLLSRHVVGPVTFAEKVIHHHLLSHTVGKLLRKERKKRMENYLRKGEREKKYMKTSKIHYGQILAVNWKEFGGLG